VHEFREDGIREIRARESFREKLGAARRFSRSNGGSAPIAVRFADSSVARSLQAVWLR